MNATRQDSWTQDEDVLLAETVLRHIRDGKTQLEAFEEVAKRLSRTSAACGFRWNATVRKQYQKGIQLAKEERKKAGKSSKDVVLTNVSHSSTQPSSSFSIDDAISFLETMKQSYGDHFSKEEREIQKLQDENETLKKQMQRYHQAWEEMGRLWKWVHIKQEKAD